MIYVSNGLLLGLLSVVQSKNNYLLRPNTTVRISDTFVFNNKTEYVLVSTRTTWREGIYYCNKFKNGSLAIVNTKEKANFLAEALSESTLFLSTLWVGAHKGTLGRESGYVWLGNNGIYVPDEHFVTRENETVSITSHRNCLSFSRRNHDVPLYINLWCGLRRPLICQKVYEPPNVIKSSSWFRVGNFEYKIFYGEVSWKQAVTNCALIKAHLASFRNITEVREVGRYLLISRPSLENAWIGAYHNGKNWTMIYLEATIPNEPDEETKFPPWIQRRPRKQSGCVLLDRHTTGANFLEARCDRKRNYICAKEIKIDVGEEDFDIGNTSYILHKKYMTWYDARDTCLEKGCDLAKVTKENMGDMMYHLSETSLDAYHIWIGGKLIEKEDGSMEFVWVVDQTAIPPRNGSLHEYPPWLSNNHSEDAPCLNMDREDHNKPMFYGLTCYSRQQFICQRNQQFVFK